MKTTKQYGKKTDLALSTWVKLARAFSTINKKSVESIRSFELTQPQFSVIESLGHLGSMKVGELCDKMLVSGGNMTLVLDNLEKNDLIERIHSKEDRRAIIVQLTANGKKLFQKVFKKHAENITELITVLSEEEQIQLSDLLKKLGLAIIDKTK
ncbi:MAG: MarR family transcriptional regulator [Melioribacteraceae bacterium]|nr:MarR family transcriptional regulator [Melioribacteraceae bacterium]